MAKSAPPKHAPTATASAPPTARGTGRPSSDAASGRSSWAQTTLIIIVVTLLLGIPPLAIGGQMLHLWNLPKGAVSIGVNSAPATITYETPLPTPASMVISTSSVQVAKSPGGGEAVATLDAGYPASVIRYAQVRIGTGAPIRWASINWSGPVNVNSASGGQGWIPASALGAPSSAPTKLVGDLGALSLGLGQKMAPYEANFLGDVYFPNDGSHYLTASTKNTFMLGGGLRSVLLVALYANQEAQHSQPNLTLLNGVAQGHDPQTGQAYHQLGDASGVGKYLAKNNIAGISLASGNWQGAHATTLALVEFFRLLDGFGSHSLLNQADQLSVRTALVNANRQSVAQLGVQSLLGQNGLLVVDTGKDGAGYWAVAAGVLTPPNGPPVILVAVAQGQASSSASLDVLRAFFDQLGPIING